MHLAVRTIDFDYPLPEELVKKGFACGVLSIDEMRERIRGWEMFA